MPVRPRLEDVAQRAGVSTATASLVIRERPGPSPETRQRVTAAAGALGYRANRTASLLARRRTHLIGVSMSLTSPFHAELVEDMHEAAAAYGYDMVVSPLTRTRDERQSAYRLVDQRCEVIILLGPSVSRPDLEALSAHTPLVVVGRRLRDRSGSARIAVVRAADDRGIAAAVGHLVGLGHERIAFVDGPPGPISTLRRDGFRRAMRRLTGDADPVVVPGGDTERAGLDAPLRGGPRPATAYVCFNDRCALGVLDQVRGAGLRVPADVSVIGFDDSPVARLHTVSLTTVSQSPLAMADAAVHSAQSLVEDAADTSPPDVLLDPPLVVRSTSGPPPVQ